MTDKSVTIPQNFEERMMDRIRNSIGELMSDDELKLFVKKAVDKVFFEPTQTRSDSWGRYEAGPSILEKIIKELLEPSVNAAVVTYIDLHPNEVRAAIQTALANGIGAAMITAVNAFFSAQLLRFQTDLEQRLTNR